MAEPKKEDSMIELSDQEKKFLSKGPAPIKKTAFKLEIPFKLRAALAWTIFFAIIGIVIQSIQAGSFIFKDFFISNYAQWFRSFGTFTSITQYSSPADLVYSIMSGWYYFLYTGGLISLIWELVSSIINSEIHFTAYKKSSENEVVKK